MHHSIRLCIDHDAAAAAASLPAAPAGRNVTLLPSPQPSKGSGLGNTSKLCESKSVEATLTFGPFDSKTCGADTQVGCLLLLAAL
jgi:hypothetical protein